MLKKWYQGRECDVRQEQDVVRAAAKLAVLHKDMEKLAVKSGPERMHREKIRWKRCEDITGN